MFASIVLAAVLGGQSSATATVCPISGTAAKADITVMTGGVAYQFCCAGCPDGFAKDPAKALASIKLKDKVVGNAMFNPVTGGKIDLAKPPKWSAVHQGTRFFFASEGDLKKFQADPRKFAAAPKLESLACPVMNAPLDNYAMAHSFADYEGVRYYFCCGGCPEAFRANPAKYVKAAKFKPSAPKIITVRDELDMLASGPVCSCGTFCAIGPCKCR